MNNKKILLFKIPSLILALVICLSFTAFAKEKNENSSNNKSGKVDYALNNGFKIKGWKKENNNIYYFNKKGCLVTGLKKIGKNTFYFKKSDKPGEKGKLLTGWRKIGKYKYFFSVSGKPGVKGKMLKNRIAGNKKTGYGYVSGSGKKINTKAIKLAVKFALKHSSLKDSRSKRLKSCFDYRKKTCPYKRVFGLPSEKNINKKFAEYALKHKACNCFGNSSAFLCIAKVLGYKTRLAVGNITTHLGGPNIHGWAEVKIGKKWYMFDVGVSRRFKANMYKKLKRQCPYKYEKNCYYYLRLKKDKAVWKKG